ncbi:MAG: plastocyanin/azurin family copper-binding protein [Verrucomicrobiota bacterium]
MKLIFTSVFSAILLVLAGCAPKESTKPAPTAPTSASATAPVSAAPAGPREIEITVGEGGGMAFSIKRIEATAGEQLKITVSNTGTMPKEVMGHNFILFNQGIDLETFGQEAAAAKPTDYIPPGFETEMIAHTRLLGPRESESLTFTVPKVPGDYTYICSTPGHYLSGMRGVLVVK